MNPFKNRNAGPDRQMAGGLKKDLEESYLRYPEPWKQAGFLLDEKSLRSECRQTIADVSISRDFWDIWLFKRISLSVLMKWTG